jgi:dipeptidyl aminopeptidase/acylaminoacyl peptidase
VRAAWLPELTYSDVATAMNERPVQMPAADGVTLEGDLRVPPGAPGIVVFAHGSGSSRFSPRNRFVAQVLVAAGLATLLMDLLTPREEAVDASTDAYRFDVGLLASRLVAASDWVAELPTTRDLRLGYFGASTGAAAALFAAAEGGDRVRAVVSRGGRPDLAADALPRVKAPTLLIVGELDHQVIQLNQVAFELLSCEKELQVVPGASHLFEEPGALEQVARLAQDWFLEHLV